MREVTLAAVQCIDHQNLCIFFADGSKKYVTLSAQQTNVLTTMHRVYLEAEDVTRRMSLWAAVALVLSVLFSYHALVIVVGMFCLWLTLKFMAWLLLYQLFPNRLLVYALVALHVGKLKEHNPNDIA